MKKLMTFCFVILMSVLSGLSCFNFAADALDRIEEDKMIVNIIKPETINNKDFLEDIDGAVKRVDADIMLRQVQNLGGKDHYKYFKTNNTERFLNISTNAKSNKLAAGECISTIKQDGYKTFRLSNSIYRHPLGCRFCILAEFMIRAAVRTIRRDSSRS